MVLCKRKFIQRSVSEDQDLDEGAQPGEKLVHRQCEQGPNKDARIIRVEGIINQTDIRSTAAAGVADVKRAANMTVESKTDADEETESEEDARSNYVEVPLFWHPLGFKPCQQFEFQFMEEHDKKWPYAKAPLKQEGKKGVSPGGQKWEDASQGKTTMQSAAQALLSLAEAFAKDENDAILVSDNGHRYYPDKRVLQHFKDRKKEHLKKRQAVDNGSNHLLTNGTYAQKPSKTMPMSTSKKVDENPSNGNLKNTRYMGGEGRIFTSPRANNICFEIPNEVYPCLPFKQIYPQVSIGLAGCRHACKLADPWDVRNPFF